MTPRQEHILDRLFRWGLIGLILLCVAGILFCWFWLGAQRNG